MTERTLTAFMGADIIVAGPEADVAAAIHSLNRGRGAPDVHVFDDATGKPVDLDPLGHTPRSAAATRGRPKLGVVAREVTLLPRHWEWLGAQSGGASAALRRMIDAARREDDGAATAREAAYRFMLDMAGDLPGYEEATRALFSGDRAGVESRIAAWPEDVRAYALRLAAPGLALSRPLTAASDRSGRSC